MRHVVILLNSVCKDWLKRYIRYKEKYSLGHLSYVFMSQAHPQVIVFMKQYLLHTRVSNPTGLIPEVEEWHYQTF